MALDDALKSLTGEAAIEGGIETSSIEVGGVKVAEIRDKAGHIWAVPADDDNVNLREYRNILEIPNREPGFYYQYVNGERLNEFLTTGFVLVDRDEIGVSNIPTDGNPLNNPGTRHHQVGNLYLVKIPEVLEQRKRRVQIMRAQEAVAGIKVPRHLGKEARQISDTGVEVHERSQEKESVRPRQEFKEE